MYIDISDIGENNQYWTDVDADVQQFGAISMARIQSLIGLIKLL